MSKRRIWILPSVVTAIAIALAVPKLLPLASSESTANASPVRGERTTAVRALTIEPSSLDSQLLLNGALAGNEAVVIKSERMGRIAEVLFEEGARVNEGQLLVRLDDSELQAEKGAVTTELELAESTFRRYRTLIDSNVVSREQFDEIQSRRNVLKARLKLIQTRIDKMAIRAPFSGVIGLRLVSPGELVDADTAIADLVVINPLKLTFGLPEIHQSRLAADLPVSLRVAGINRTFTGTVYAWNPRIEESSRTVAVRAKVDNPEGLLLPGNFASVTVTLETFTEALMIPATALVRGLEESIIYVVEDGVAKRRAVSVGVRTRDQVQVLDGLQVGDQVVYQGVQSLRDGRRVTLVEGDIASATERVAPST